MGIFDILLNTITGRMINKALDKSNGLQDSLLSKGYPLTKDEIWQIILKVCAEKGLNSLHAGLIYSQGILESTHYSSNTFQKDNNAFGMKWSSSQFVAGKGVRAPSREAKTAAQQAINFYAHYNTFADSVRDLIRRHISFGLDWTTVRNANDYIDFLVRTKYFQGAASLYRSIVSSTFKKLNISQSA